MKEEEGILKSKEGKVFTVLKKAKISILKIILLLRRKKRQLQKKNKLKMSLVRSQQYICSIYNNYATKNGKKEVNQQE